MISASGVAQVELSPTVLSAAGGYSNNGEISLSWTLGELAVTTLSGGNMIMTQGFQQPVDKVVGIRQNKMEWDISVYPNPVRDELQVRFNIKKSGDFIVEVQDVSGRLIRQQLYKQVKPGDLIKLNTSAFTEGLYFIKLYTSDRQYIQVTSLSKL